MERSCICTQQQSVHTQQFPVTGAGHGVAAEVFGDGLYGFELLQVGRDQLVAVWGSARWCLPFLGGRGGPSAWSG